MKRVILLIMLYMVASLSYATESLINQNITFCIKDFEISRDSNGCISILAYNSHDSFFMGWQGLPVYILTIPLPTSSHYVEMDYEIVDSLVADSCRMSDPNIIPITSYDVETFYSETSPTTVNRISMYEERSNNNGKNGSCLIFHIYPFWYDQIAHSLYFANKIHLQIQLGGTNAIIDIDNKNNRMPAILYNLSGRRLSARPVKGLYIEDGKVKSGK